LERPAVHRLAVALLEDDLRREILRGAAQRPAAVLDVLGKAEVGQLERAVLVKQSHRQDGRSEYTCFRCARVGPSRATRDAVLRVRVVCVLCVCCVFCVLCLRDEDVLKLQIAVHDAERVQVLDG
jgi:hypothetical protein